MTARTEKNRGRLLYFSASAVEAGTPAHTHVHGIVDGLIRRGWSVRVVSPAPARLDGLPGQLRRLCDVVVRQLRAGIRIRTYDVLYCRCHFGLWPISLWARLRGVPVIQEINGPYSDYFAAHPYMAWARWPVTFSIRAQMRLADALVVVTEPMKTWIAGEVSARRVAVVPNGADTRRFRPGAGDRPTVEGRYAVFVGSLAVWQGIGTMIDAVWHPDWPSDVRLVIAGDGAERAVVEEAAGRSDRIVYLGPVPHEAVPGLICGSIAGLAPKVPVGGLAETGFSALKLYESLACGVPVVASDAMGHRETIRHNDCGILIPVGDAGALARAVAALGEDPERARAMGERGLDFVRREASWDRRAGDVDGLIRQVTGETMARLVGNAQ